MLDELLQDRGTFADWPTIPHFLVGSL